MGLKRSSCGSVLWFFMPPIKPMVSEVCGFCQPQFVHSVMRSSTGVFCVMIFVSLFTEEYQLKAAIFSNNSCPFVTGSKHYHTIPFSFSFFCASDIPSDAAALIICSTLQIIHHAFADTSIEISIGKVFIYFNGRV